MAVNDFIMTMDSDEEQPLTSFKESKSRKSQNVDPEDAQLNAEFTFDLAGDPYADILGEQNLRDLVKKGSRPVRSCLRFGGPINQVSLLRNQYLSTTSLRDENYPHTLESASETLSKIRRTSKVKIIAMKKGKRKKPSLTLMRKRTHLRLRTKRVEITEKMTTKARTNSSMRMMIFQMQHLLLPMTLNPKHRQRWIARQPSSTRK
jgi:hypothetical protein